MKDENKCKLGELKPEEKTDRKYFRRKVYSVPLMVEILKSDATYFDTDSVQKKTTK